MDKKEEGIRYYKKGILFELWVEKILNDNEGRLYFCIEVVSY